MSEAPAPMSENGRSARANTLPGPASNPLQSERAQTIFEKGAPGRRAFMCPALDVPEAGEEVLPPRFRRSAPPRLPEVSEPELVRHYVRISKRNFDLDSVPTTRSRKLTIRHRLSGAAGPGSVEH